jgi:feruloyl esterase
MGKTKAAMLAAAAMGEAMLGHPGAAKADEIACRSMTAAGLLPDTRITSAHMVAAANGAASFCELKGVISPNPKSHIGVVFRLPDNWNGRVLGIGGGGWEGNITIEAAQPGLARGYATLQTDGGHERATTGAFSTAWAKDNPDAVTDFSWRAVHLTAAVGKTAAARYYNKPLALAVFQGCSTGGRMGLMEAQRFPADYDAIVAGAPVFTLQVQTSGIVRRRFFTTPTSALSDAQIKLTNDKVLEACDGLDGLKDGIVTDPRACRWDPIAIQCQRGAPASDSCLTSDQVGAVRRAYATVRSSDGKVAFYGLSRSGELGWSAFIPMRPQAEAAAPNYINGLMYGDTDPALARFDPEKDTSTVRATPFAKEYEAGDPDLRPFLARGGKLLLWHGFDDPAPSPYGTEAYYKQVKDIAGADAAMRLFLAPGVYHCRGGPGAHTFDTLAAMDGWIDSGKAPDVIPASNPEKGITRPLCAWPALAFYREGDPNAAASFACRVSNVRTASAN